jgi:hypothetical protein
MKITKRQIRRIIKEALAPEFSRFRSLRNFLQTVIWPCYQDGMSVEECYRSALGAQELQLLRRHKQDILEVNDNPEFIAYAYEIALLA